MVGHAGAVTVTFPIWSPIMAIQQEVDRGIEQAFGICASPREQVSV